MPNGANNARNAREEPSPFNPFRRAPKIGPGPKGRVTRQAKRWRCRCEQVSPTKSKCVCTGLKTATGRVSRARKKFTIDLKKKAKYRREYQRWLKARGQ